jgi:hypothetical protein
MPVMPLATATVSSMPLCVEYRGRRVAANILPAIMYKKKIVI